MKLMLNGKEVSGMGHYVMAGDIKDATAEDSNVLSGKAFYNNNGKREGTMPNRGGMSAELAAGGSVSIPEGYHNGEGVVRAQDLASQTQGDAGAGNIDSGKTAWVNGVQVTGTSTKVDTSGATATAGNIEKGYTAWVNGQKITGTNEEIVGEQVMLDLTGYTNKGDLSSTKWTMDPAKNIIFINYGTAIVKVCRTGYYGDNGQPNTAVVLFKLPVGAIRKVKGISTLANGEYSGTSKVEVWVEN